MTHQSEIAETLQHIDDRYSSGRVDRIDLLNRDEDAVQAPLSQLIGQ